jgi:anti-anti-sigma factor
VTLPPPRTPARFEFASTDPVETREYLDRTYGWRMTDQRPGDPRQPLTVSMIDAGIVGSAHAVAPGDLAYRVTGEGFVVVDSLLEGTFELEHPDGTDRYGPGDVFVANHPAADFAAGTHGIRVLTTIMPAALLDDTAAPAGGAPVRFVSHAPADGDGRHWRAFSRGVHELLDDPDAGSAPLVVGAAARQLAALALVTFPNTAVATPTRTDRRDGHPATLRRAMAFIEAAPDRDLSLADIARAAHVTPRAVQLAFRRHLGTTPMAYLRRVRLAEAHDELRRTTPEDGSTITRIALRWGFASPSRFSEQYRDAYGVTPSQTLRRRPAEPEGRTSPLVSTTTTVPSGHEVTFAGPIDSMTVREFTSAVWAAVEATPPGEVVVDLTGVEILGAIAVRTLSHLATQTRARGQRLRVRGGSPVHVRMLRLGGVGHLLEP